MVREDRELVALLKTGDAEALEQLIMRRRAGAEAYALIKAGEEGAAAYEQCCGKLHGMLAERLRQGTAFPGLSPRYFGG